jgi:hypothetical protein
MLLYSLTTSLAKPSSLPILSIINNLEKNSVSSSEQFNSLAASLALILTIYSLSLAFY